MKSIIAKDVLHFRLVVVIFAAMKRIIITLSALCMALIGLAQSTYSSSSGGRNSSTGSQEDPCVDIADLRYCWTLDPYTGSRRAASLDSSHIGYCATDVMEAKSLCMNFLGNLWSPHQSEQYFARPEGNDFIFADAYSLFTTRPEQQIYYNTRIPFTVASYLKSGSNLQANDHLMIDFAGNISSRVGVGTSLDYVYARGQYQSQGTKPLKWLSYFYYTGERYNAYLSTNISYYGNQENGGITDRGYVLTPEKYNSNFTEAANMPTNLVDTWNATDHRNVHFTHSYDMGFYRTTIDEDSAEQESFVPVATLFNTIDFNSYRRTFRMDPGADASGGNFFEHNYINSTSTADTMGLNDFSVLAGIRLNEGFHKYSQFGIAAFIGYELQKYTSMVDTLDRSYIRSTHNSHNVWLGGTISRHLSSALTFDITARTCLSGDKVGDVDITGEVGTVVPFGKSDSLVVSAGGFLRNKRVSWFMDHFFSNHFRWRNDFDREQRLRLQGAITYPRTRTTIKGGVEHINNYHYFGSDGLPHQYGNQLDIFSLEARQTLRAGILWWENALLFQTSTEEKVLPLPKFAVHSDLSLRFKIARTLDTQLGVAGYYYTRYYAPNYNPATQQFCVQDQIQCGNFPIFNGYVNCHLKNCRFFVMMYNMLDGAITNDTFIGPYYPTMPRRLEWGVSIDFQN